VTGPGQYEMLSEAKFFDYPNTHFCSDEFASGLIARARGVKIIFQGVLSHKRIGQRGGILSCSESANKER
jgi:hypothetical protein